MLRTCTQIRLLNRSLIFGVGGSSEVQANVEITKDALTVRPDVALRNVCLAQPVLILSVQILPVVPKDGELPPVMKFSIVVSRCCPSMMSRLGGIRFKDVDDEPADTKAEEDRLDEALLLLQRPHEGPLKRGALEAHRCGLREIHLAALDHFHFTDQATDCSSRSRMRNMAERGRGNLYGADATAFQQARRPGEYEDEVQSMGLGASGAGPHSLKGSIIKAATMTSFARL